MMTHLSFKLFEVAFRHPLTNRKDMDPLPSNCLKAEKYDRLDGSKDLPLWGCITRIVCIVKYTRSTTNCCKKAGLFEPSPASQFATAKL